MPADCSPSLNVVSNIFTFSLAILISPDFCNFEHQLDITKPLTSGGSSPPNLVLPKPNFGGELL
jgi:hypothetical protein